MPLSSIVPALKPIPQFLHFVFSPGIPYVFWLSAIIITEYTLKNGSPVKACVLGIDWITSKTLCAGDPSGSLSTA